MPFKDRVIAAMGNRGFTLAGPVTGRQIKFEGAGNKKQVTVELPVDEPDDPEAVCTALVIDAEARVVASE